MAKPVAALDYLLNPTKHAAGLVCVVFGDDPFLKRLVLNELVGQVLKDDEKDFSRTTFRGDETEPRDVFDELKTLAMFGGKRLVVIEEADDFVSSYRTELEDYVARPIATGVLVLEVKSWPSNTRLAKALTESGLQVDCKVPTDAALVKWLPSWATRRHQVTLEADATERLVELVGPEPGLLEQELSKLALLTSNTAGQAGTANRHGTITRQLVDDTVGTWRTRTAWEMLDAAADGNVREALVQLDRLLLSGDEPVALLGMIASTLRRFAAATRVIQQYEAAGRRVTLAQALQEAGFKSWPAALQRAERQLRQLGRPRASQLYRWLLEADLAIKGVSSSPPRARLVLEQLFVRMSSNLAPGKTAPQPARR